MSNPSNELPVVPTNNLTADAGLRAKLGNSFAEAAAITDVYDRVRPPYPRAVVDKILDFSGIAGIPDVLDVGCGTGIGTLPLAEAGCQVYALDPSPAFIDTARYKLSDFPNVDFALGKLEELAIEPQSRDIVVAAQSFHWLPENKWQLAHNVLKPEGVLALMSNFPETDDPSDPDSRREKAVRQLYEAACPTFPAVNYGSLDSMIQEEAESGLFGEPQVVTVRHDKVYDAADYMDFQRSLSWVNALPDEQQADFLSKVEALLQPDDDHTVTLPFKTVAFMARALPTGE